MIAGFRVTSKSSPCTPKTAQFSLKKSKTILLNLFLIAAVLKAPFLKTIPTRLWVRLFFTDRTVRISLSNRTDDCLGKAPTGNLNCLESMAQAKLNRKALAAFLATSAQNTASSVALLARQKPVSPSAFLLFRLICSRHSS